MDGSSAPHPATLRTHRLRARSPAAVEAVDRPPLARHPPETALRRVRRRAGAPRVEQRCPEVGAAVYAWLRPRSRPWLDANRSTPLGGGLAHEGRARRSSPVRRPSLTCGSLHRISSTPSASAIGRPGSGWPTRSGRACGRDDGAPRPAPAPRGGPCPRSSGRTPCGLARRARRPPRHERRATTAATASPEGPRPTTEAVLHRSPEVTQTRPAGPMRSVRAPRRSRRRRRRRRRPVRRPRARASLIGGRWRAGSSSVLMQESVIHICTEREWD